MYGMPLSQALAFALSVAILFIATEWRRFHPFLVIIVIASAFGLIAGFTTAQLAGVFGSGFSAMIYSPGLVIVAAALIAGLAEGTGASDRLKVLVKRRQRLSPRWTMSVIGLIAGIGSSPSSAFALLTPLLRPLGGDTAQSRERATVALALAISSSHGLLLLAPVPIAAAAILDAEWYRLALFGVPLAILLAAFAAVFARWGSAFASSPPPLAQQSAVELLPGEEKKGRSFPIVLVLATAVPVLLLMVQSIGDMPTEPLGGGPARELVLGIGHPLILFLVSVGIMTAGHLRQSLSRFTNPAWIERVLGNVAGILLTACAAGGLQRLCQETGMAEMVGERLAGWHGWVIGGVLVPFLVAAAMKTLQGSSLVAAITAAGIVHPILPQLGLIDANAKALAALAVGAGAITASHVNDDYFWVVTQSAGLRPLRGLATIGLGTLLQGFIAAVALLIMSFLIAPSI
ncbi:MAG: GntP family permease [Xanthobacteraceae bacterium]